MNYENLQHAIREAERFLLAARALSDDCRTCNIAGKPTLLVNSGRLSGSARRASIDLTRALWDLTKEAGSMSTDFRALLSHIAIQLIYATDPDDLGIRADQLVKQIGAALAQTPAAGPTAADFHAWWRDQAHPGTAPSPDLTQAAMEWGRYCLDRWGRRAVAAGDPPDGARELIQPTEQQT